MDLNSWFLGFFEADGCFTYCKQGGITPTLYIGQQDDMGSVPPGIRMTTYLFRRGYINNVQPKATRYIRKGLRTDYKRQWKAWCRSKDALLDVLWFFDQHPLISARKQRDYRTWRKMALCYITNGCHDEQLPALAAELSSDGRTKYVV